MKPASQHDGPGVEVTEKARAGAVDGVRRSLFTKYLPLALAGGAAGFALKQVTGRRSESQDDEESEPSLLERMLRQESTVPFGEQSLTIRGESSREVASLTYADARTKELVDEWVAGGSPAVIRELTDGDAIQRVADGEIGPRHTDFMFDAKTGQLTVHSEVNEGFHTTSSWGSGGTFAGIPVFVTREKSGERKVLEAMHVVGKEQTMRLLFIFVDPETNAGMQVVVERDPDGSYDVYPKPFPYKPTAKPKGTEKVKAGLDA
jgi:hypothetical protein